MKKELNEGIKNWQERTKKKTVQAVEKAIRFLQDEGYQGSQINYIRLMGKTGFSRSLFSKKHVKELLKKYAVAEFASRKVLDDRQTLERELRKGQQDFLKLQKRFERSEEIKRKLKEELQKKELELQMLRGEMQFLYQRAKARGVDLE